MEWLLWLAILATTSLFWLPRQRLTQTQKRWFLRVVTLSQVIPFLALTSLFISSDVSYDLVRLYGGQEMPLLYRLSAVWAGREGPTLLWAGMMAICGHIFSDKSETPTANLTEKIHNGSVLLLLLLALMMQPFRLSQGSWVGELNPLLQTDLMVIHPPLVYLFYSLCLTVMSIGLGHLFSAESGASERIIEAVTPAARAALVAGTVGIGMGGLWAYTVLDWGGYWAWDPVETGSLLPWLALLLLLHLRITPGGSATRWAAPLAILPGWFSIHATMVTRANGVWASVHAFVGEGGEAQAADAFGRIVNLQGSGMAGTEVTTYLISLIVLMSVTVSWLVSKQAALKDLERWRRGSLWALAAVLGLPISYIFSVIMLGGEVSLVEQIPSQIILLLACAPVLLLFLNMDEARAKLFGEWWQRISITLCVVVAMFAEDTVVAFLLIMMMLLKISSDESGRKVWTTAGVVVILASVYAYLIEITVGGILLLIFIWEMLIQEQDDEDFSLSEWIQKLFDRSTQSKLARSTPVVVGGIYLTLTWMLMLASIDGTSLAMHEMFGAPLLVLITAALATYAWRKSVSSRHLPLVLLALVAAGLLFGVILELPLGGNADSQFSDLVTRGDVVWLVLPMLIVAIPAITHLVWLLARRAWQRNKSPKDGDSEKARYRSAKAKAVGWRSTLSHLAHLGILLLLVGHLLTTTLIERSDPSHQVVLPLDEEIEHDGLHLIFTDWEVLSADDSEFSQRFKVGDGYLGAKIDIVDEEGNLLDTVTPGMLRFDNSGFPRSETDRYFSLTGDYVFIFDWSQTQALGNASSAMGGGSQEVPLTTVRLTVYSLEGSHLVWLGWVLIMLSTAALWVTEQRGAQRGEQRGLQQA